ncbi:MAG TPA: dipeptide epimerase [Rhizomicrobium sp.]|jgi:L-alanine-DL-glutamate epimerase-like enolase superfamily enzyme
MPLQMIFAYQEWPYRQTFKFARETREAAPNFVVHVSDGEHIGRGECGLQSLKNETAQGVAAQLRDIADNIAVMETRAELNRRIPAQSSRNAVDCALWDLECKRSGKSIWELTGVAKTDKIEVDITIGINSLEKMRADAVAAVMRGYSLLKLKADAHSIVEKAAAIAQAVPGARFIVDANEAWSLDQLKTLAPQLKALNVVLIEQPLHHDADAPLAGYDSPVPLCADESCATAAQIGMLAERYDSVNIKLDKTGGLTEALALARAAREHGLGLMMGSNGGTSLGNAPAYVIGTLCDYRDIDSHELLFEDRRGGMPTRNGELYAFDSRFWG